MKRLSKKIVFLFLITMILSLPFVIKTEAYVEQKEGYFTYYINSDNNALITKIDSNASGHLVIPSELGGCPVISVDNMLSSPEITSVDIPETVTSIEDWAFHSCQKLETVKLSEGLRRIGTRAFRTCTSLTNINLPESLIEIGDQAFCDCRSLNGDLIFSDNVIRIGEEAFASCSNIDNVIIGDSVESIGNKAFYRSSVENVSFGSNLVEIGDEAFYWTNIKKVELPASLLSIGNCTFQNCHYLTEANLSEGLEHIGNMAFYNCSTLTKINYPDSLKHIGASTLDFTAYYADKNNWEKTNSVDALYVGSHLIDTNSFISRTSDFYKVKEGTITIAAAAFQSNENLSTVIIPFGARSIGESAFSYCKKLKKVHFPDSLIFIGEYVFHETADVVICSPNNVNTLVQECVNKNGFKFEICSGLHFEKPDNTPTELIVSPSKKIINYGDSIVLHADIENTPENAKIKWTVDNNNFEIVEISADGKTCTITPVSSGSTVFTITIYDENGNLIGSDTQEMESVAGLWQKIVAFFKKLFGLTKTYSHFYK